MVPLKRSFYLNDRTLSILGPVENLSGRINDLIDRYGVLMSLYRTQVLDRFSSNELDLVRSAFSDSKLKSKSFSTVLVDFNPLFTSSMKTGSLSTWAAENPALALDLKTKIAQLDPLSLLCLTDWLEENK